MHSDTIVSGGKMRGINPGRLRGSFVWLLVLGMLATAAWGQGAASIVGTVTDPTGAIVPNAKVTITHVETGSVHSTLTNATGNYAARDLGLGHYNVQVEAPGFKTSARTGVTLNVNET